MDSPNSLGREITSGIEREREREHARIPKVLSEGVQLLQRLFFLV